MKVGQYEVNVKNGFNLLGTGFVGLFILLILVGVLLGRFTMWFGKLFLNFGKSYGNAMDKKMKGIDEQNKVEAKQ